MLTNGKVEKILLTSKWLNINQVILYKKFIN